MVALPAGQEEVFASSRTCTGSWCPIALLVLLWEPSSRWEQGVGCLVVFAAATVDLIALALAPLVLARLVAGPPRPSRPIPFAWMAGIALHLVLKL